MQSSIFFFLPFLLVPIPHEARLFHSGLLGGSVPRCDVQTLHLTNSGDMKDLKASCVIDRGGIFGYVEFETVVDEAEQPQGTRITVNIVDDEYEVVGDDTVWAIDQYSDINGCLVNQTGGMFDPTGAKPALGDLYKKMGGMMRVQLQTTLLTVQKMDQTVADIRLYGPHSVIGRSVIVQNYNGSRAACCTIFLKSGDYVPTKPSLVNCMQQCSCTKRTNP